MMSERGVEREGGTVPNLFSNFDACLDAIIKIETEAAGHELNGRQRADLQAAVSGALGQAAESRLFAELGAEDFSAKHRVAGFAGLEGGNRYQVDGKGRIFSSKRHMHSENARYKAEELGIGIDE